MTRDQMLAHLRAADEVAREAAAHGHHPFGAVLVGPDDRILMRQGNIDTVRHAETELCPARRGGLSGGFPVDLHAGLDRRALRHVHRHALLGEYRPLGLWFRGGEAPRGDRRPRREPDHEPRRRGRSSAPARSRSRSLAPSPRSRTSSSPRTGPSGDADEPPFRRSCQGLTLASRGQAHMIGHAPERNVGHPSSHRLTDAAPKVGAP